MVSRHQRQKKQLQKAQEDNIKEANGELRARLKKLEKDNKRLRQENRLLKNELGKSDKFIKKYVKKLKVADIVEEIEEEKIATGEIEDIRCPKCRAPYKIQTLPFGVLKICTNKDCDWREVVKD